MTKNFGTFVKKETLQILRDYRTMLVIILMPIVQIVLFGFALSMEINNIDVAICSTVRNETVRRIADRMNTCNEITFWGYLDNPAEIDGLMKRNAVDIAIVIDPDIDRIITGQDPDRPAISIVTDATNTVMSGLAVNYVSSTLSDHFNSENDLPYRIETRMLYNPRLLSSYTFVPGILGLIILIICTMITSISIVREKETGTIELVLVSPIKPLYVIGAKMIPYFVLSCINLATILLLAAYLLDVPMTGSLTAICGVSLLYIIMSLAWGVLISTFSNNQVMAILISAVVMIIPVMMLSGLIFPIENIPKALQYLSCIVPARWYIDAMRKLMIEGVPIAAVWEDIAILTVMTVVFIMAAVKQFKDKLN